MSVFAVENLGRAISLIHFLAATWAASHALLTKPDSRSAFGWIGVCVLFPIAGPLLYWLFGINRIRTRARQLRSNASVRPKALPVRIDEGTQLTRIGDAVTQWSLVVGNEIEPLKDGERAFAAMLSAIETANHIVWLSTYIFDTDAVGRRFVDALAAAKARGADVRVLIDGVGELYSWPRAGRMLYRAGIRFARFLPPSLLPPRIALNLRNHRKLLLADDIGFMGGMNLGGREIERMRDMHFRVRGPVLSQLAEVFIADWHFVTRERLPAPVGNRATVEQATCRIITDGPDEDVDKLLFVILGAISIARTRVRIMTPYLIPPAELIAVLQAAALRGVDVVIVLPQRSNLRYVDWASRRFFTPLLQRGVRIFLQRPPFSHAKLLVIDDEYAQVGSANLDTRSLRLNFEISMEIYDRGICASLSEHIEVAMRDSVGLDSQTLGEASLAHRFRDSVCWLLSPYL